MSVRLVSQDRHKKTSDTFKWMVIRVLRFVMVLVIDLVEDYQ